MNYKINHRSYDERRSWSAFSSWGIFGSWHASSRCGVLNDYIVSFSAVSLGGIRAFSSTGLWSLQDMSEDSLVESCQGVE